MRQKQGVFSLFLLSPSSRRAWIEIVSAVGSALQFGGSPSSRRAWIEIDDCDYDAMTQSWSPSSRRAWIEIGRRSGCPRR